MIQGFKNEYRPYQVRDSQLYNKVLHTCLSKNCMSVKVNLENYDKPKRTYIKCMK
jgi:hypothetical protein